VECEDIFDADNMHLGQIDYKHAKILLNKDAADEIKSETLFHEIMHGILVHIGRDDLSQDETFVTALGNAVWQSFIVRDIDIDED
jgi:Zn-dependent peptidase ImmA (M78 family)